MKTKVDGVVITTNYKRESDGEHVVPANAGMAAYIRLQLRT